VDGTGDNLGVLREAIARNAGMVLSLPHAGRLRHHKSRFLADAGDGFWVRSVPEEQIVIRQLIAARQPAGVTFRDGENKVIFAAEIQHLEEHYERSAPVDDPSAGPVEALLMKFPDALQSVQRRKSFRIPIGELTELQVKAWSVTEQASLRDRPPASREIDCAARDISVGGIGLTVRAQGGKAPALSEGDRVRVQLTLRDAVAVLEGRVRYPPRANKDSSFRAGIQFKTLTDSRDDRIAGSMLNKIVNELQRELIRRKKLGI
jgi:c-di-GMP-binding flagellar brake protein YcgR